MITSDGSSGITGDSLNERQVVGMKILVTGGAGFIGSNVADGYVKEGHDVIIVDDLSSGSRENVNPSARFFEMDIRSKAFEELVASERPDVINHHAAQISVPASVENPTYDAHINIIGFLNLLEAARKAGVEKIIFISSGGAIYGEALEYPTSEAWQPRPLSPYAVSKYASEHYLHYYRHQYGMEYLTLRYANVYGPRQIPHGEAGVVAIFMNNLLEGKRSFVNHFPQDEMGMVRDYCFVGDVVRANIAALLRGSCEAVNIGTGVETRTLTLYKTVYSAMKEKLPDVSEELSMPGRRLARPGDLSRSCLVVSRAREVLGWEPQTDLKNGIGRTLDWRLAESRR